MKTGPNFVEPPRELVARLAARAPQFWDQFTRGLDWALEPLDAELVNWYRDPAHNARVGGQVNSQHRYGTAIDLVVPRSQWAAAISRLRRAGFLVIDEGDHLHAQAFPAGALQRAGVRPG